MKRIAIRLAILIASLAAGAAEAQPYPSKPIRIIVGFAPGGGSDFIARVIAQKLTERLGTQVIVENRPGAGSTLGTELVVKSPADGYTLLLSSASYTVNPSVYKLSFDPLNDITPIVQLSRGPYVVAVHPSVPARTLSELVALAKREPDKFTYASSGNGGHVHVATEYFLYTAGIKITHVPYKGTGPALNDTIGGSVHMILGSVATALQHVNPDASERSRSPRPSESPQRLTCPRWGSRVIRLMRSPIGMASSVPEDCRKTSSSASTGRSTSRSSPKTWKRFWRATASSRRGVPLRNLPRSSRARSGAGARW